MCVCIVWIKYLGFSNFLKGCTCFENNFNWHPVEDLVFVHGIVTNIEHGFDTSDSSSGFCPLVDCLCNFLNWSPVNEHSFFAFCSIISELVCLHPVADLSQRFHAQLPVDRLVLAYLRCVEFSKRNRVNSFWFAVGMNQVSPHLHLSLTRVHILLDSTVPSFISIQQTYVKKKGQAW